MSARLSCGPPSSCSFEGRYAPRSPDPRTNDHRPHAHLKADTPREAPTPHQRPPSACSFEGRYAPRSPDPRTNDENTVLTTANRRRTRAEATRRAPTFKLLAWKEELRRPWSPASTPKFDVLLEQQSWRQERSTGCKSMPDPRPASGTPPDCSGETCSLSEETKAPQRQQLVPPATRHNTAEGACHTPLSHVSRGGACCRRVTCAACVKGIKQIYCVRCV